MQYGLKSQTMQLTEEWKNRPTRQKMIFEFFYFFLIILILNFLKLF